MIAIKLRGTETCIWASMTIAALQILADMVVTEKFSDASQFPAGLSSLGSWAWATGHVSRNGIDRVDPYLANFAILSGLISHFLIGLLVITMAVLTCQLARLNDGANYPPMDRSVQSDLIRKQSLLALLVLLPFAGLFMFAAVRYTGQTPGPITIFSASAVWMLGLFSMLISLAVVHYMNRIPPTE